MNNLDMFQSMFLKIYRFGWWNLKIVSSDVGSQFTFTEFKEELQNRRAHLTLAVPEHQVIMDISKLHREHSVQMHTHLW